MRNTLGLAVFAAAALTSQASAQLFAAIAPEARSVTYENQVTFFVSGLNNTAAPLTNCRAFVEGRDGDGLRNISYQSVNALNETNQFANTPVDIPPGGVQGFVIAFSYDRPETPDPLGYRNNTAVPVVECNEARSVYPFNLVASVSTSSLASADIIAIGQTPTGDGVVRIGSAGGTEVFATAAVNIGQDSRVLVLPSSDDSIGLPALATICETGTDGACLAPPTNSIEIDFDRNIVRTFSAFLQSDENSSIAFAPDLTRVRIEFRRMLPDPNQPDGFLIGPVSGATSAALTSPPPAILPRGPGGRYSVAFTNLDETGSRLLGSANSIFMIAPDGDFTTAVFGSEGLFTPEGPNFFTFLNNPGTTEQQVLPDGRIELVAERIEVSLPLAFKTPFLADMEAVITPGEGLTGTIILPETVDLPDPTFRGNVNGFSSFTPMTLEDISGNWGFRLTLAQLLFEGELQIEETGALTFNVTTPEYSSCTSPGQIEDLDPTTNLFRLSFQLPTIEEGCLIGPAGTTLSGMAYAGIEIMDGEITGPISLTLIMTTPLPDGETFIASSLRPVE